MNSETKDLADNQHEETEEANLNSPNNQRRVTKYAALFLILTAATGYFRAMREEQQFKPYFDAYSLYPESNPKIYAGQIHYSRIPVEYWEHRVQMVKALGLNALSIYVMWNYHEVERGVFDFETDNRNLSRFLELA